MKNEFTFLSNDNQTNIHVIEWVPEVIIGVLQISHGMVEFIDRYDRFAKFLNSKGFYVVGNDHLGHGYSVTEEENLGYFGDNKYVIEDIHKLYTITKEKYPDVPYILLGHSMGSFLARQYISIYGDELDKAIIMGTGDNSNTIVNTAMFLCKVIASRKGWRYRSPFINNMALGSYNKAFEPARTHNDWLTKDESIVDAYNSEPLNNFVFTLNAYYNMFKGIKYANNHIDDIPKDLPILLVSGENDPVGNMGKGVLNIYKSYQKHNLNNLTLQLFKDDRHEILNELDYEDVYEFLYEWIVKDVA